MNLDEIRDALFQSLDDQLAADKATLETNQILNQEKIMYNNDARGTLYSGQPTWERAQLATEATKSLADLENDNMNNKLSVWKNITNTLDQINSYNKSAAALTKASSNTTNNNTDLTYLEIYNGLVGGD